MTAAAAHILLVEDEPAHAELVRRSFEVREDLFRLSVAENLGEARLVLGTDPPPTLVIADYRLPDGDGMDLIQASGTQGRIPVVLMTSHGNERVAVEAMKAGVLDYVVKSETTLLDMPHIAERAMRQWDDMAARHRMEEALRRSEEQYRHLVEDIFDVIFALDARGVVTYISPAVTRLAGYAPVELLGQSVHQLIHPDELPIVQSVLEKTLRGQSAMDEFRLRTRLGHWLWVRGSSRPIESDGQVVGLRGVLTDVTDRKRAETELVALNAELEKRVEERTAELVAANARLTELDRLKSKFISDVSHELRNPVGNLMLYLGMLDRAPAERLPRYLSTLREQANLVAQLITDILDLSRLEREAASAVFAPVDLNTLAEQVVSAHLPRAEAAGLTLFFEPVPELPLVRGVPNQLIQVITNLVGNAINYTQAGQVRVSSQLRDGQACLQVQDSGVGIAPEDLPHLFERFYRGQRTVELGIPGTGLGLGIVKEILDAHGGSIAVDSRLGEGTTFTVCLPLWTE